MPYDVYKKSSGDKKYCLKNKETGEERCFETAKDRTKWLKYVYSQVEDSEGDSNG